jgi:hypothetical protein
MVVTVVYYKICDPSTVGNVTRYNETPSISAYDVVRISAISLNISSRNWIFIH